MRFFRLIAGTVRLLRAVIVPAAMVACGSAVAADAGRDYVIGEGDAVRIVVFQNPDLTLETRVSESGVVSYPLLGQITLGGLTVAQAEQRITDSLRSGNFLKQPQVTLVVAQIRANQASALGQFNRPGRYPIEMHAMRLSDLVAQAGGVATGGADVVTLTGTRNGQPYQVDVDLPALLTKRKGEDPVVRNGDIVYADRMPTVYVYGEVQRPGQIRLERDMNVRQAVASGGGLNPRGTERGIRLHRRTEGGATETVRPEMTDRLRDGDILFVPESIF